MTSFAGFGERFDPVPAEVAMRLRKIDRAAGRGDLLRQQAPGFLEVLRERAQVESVEASSAIEGVTAPHRRAEIVIRDQSALPRNRSEEELRGYSNALRYIFDRAADESHLSVGLLLHLHRLLYEPTGLVGAGQFKTRDNLVVGRSPDGKRETRFTPVSAAATPSMVAELAGIYENVVERGVHHPIVLIAGFALDFTVIHPFADGNGRVSRLLINHLLDRSGYDVCRYESIERHIEQTKDRYYDVLLASTHDWHDGTHDVWPWTRYLIEIVESAYETFVDRTEQAGFEMSKPERVRQYLQKHGHQSFSIQDLRHALPGVSDSTIRAVLHQLRDQGLVTATTGRSATWRWRTGH
jgi:Fic family protein